MNGESYLKITYLNTSNTYNNNNTNIDNNDNVSTVLKSIKSHLIENLKINPSNIHHIDNCPAKGSTINPTPNKPSIADNVQLPFRFIFC